MAIEEAVVEAVVVAEEETKAAAAARLACGPYLCLMVLVLREGWCTLDMMVCVLGEDCCTCISQARLYRIVFF